jgi:hypothetical protein
MKLTSITVLTIVLMIFQVIAFAYVIIKYGRDTTQKRKLGLSMQILNLNSRGASAKTTGDIDSVVSPVTPTTKVMHHHKTSSETFNPMILMALPLTESMRKL